MPPPASMAGPLRIQPRPVGPVALSSAPSLWRSRRVRTALKSRFASTTQPCSVTASSQPS